MDSPVGSQKSMTNDFRDGTLVNARIFLTVISLRDNLMRLEIGKGLTGK